MRMFSDLKWEDWLLGLAGAFIGGGSSAIVSGAVTGLQFPEHYNLSGGLWNTLELMGTTFLLSGLMSAYLFLKQKPTPDRVTETVRVTPESITATKVTETNTVPAPAEREEKP